MELNESTEVSDKKTITVNLGRGVPVTQTDKASISTGKKTEKIAVSSGANAGIIPNPNVEWSATYGSNGVVYLSTDFSADTQIGRISVEGNVNISMGGSRGTNNLLLKMHRREYKLVLVRKGTNTIFK